MTHLRPIPDDPGGPQIRDMFDLRTEDWFLTAAGDYQASAAEAWKEDGSNWQRVVILEWPGRNKATKKDTTLRLMLSPEDAVGLAEVLVHSGLWLMEDEEKGRSH